MSSVVVRASNVCFSFVHAKTILNEVNFAIREGSKFTIMGQNGAGKSTIIKLINGTLKVNMIICFDYYSH